MTKTKITEPKKAVIFARVSTQEQFDEGCSIEAQIRLMEEYCKKHNLKIIKQFKVIGNHINCRKQLKECFSFIKDQNEKIALVSHRIDRLCGKFTDVIKLNDLIGQEKITLDFPDIGRIDTACDDIEDELLLKMRIILNNNLAHERSVAAKKDHLNRKLKATNNNK